MGAERAAAYGTNGYVVVRSLVAGPFVDAARSLLPTGRSGLVAVPLGSSTGLSALSVDPRLVALAGSLLDGPVSCFGLTFVVKPPASGPGFRALWHQDGLPWARDLGIASAVTLWVALDPTGLDSGAMAVIPGSHSLPAQPLSYVPASGGLFGAGIDPSLVDPSQAVTLTMAPGDVSAHHPQLIHGSAPNTSARSRRALVLRYRPSAG